MGPYPAGVIPKAVPVTPTTKAKSDDDRKAILNAAVSGDEQTVKAMLDKTPALIGATVKSTGNSLLHMAAGNGHESICQLLLEKGHVTNPVNKDGKTPYEYATTADIKQLLVKSHTKALCDELFPHSPTILPLQVMENLGPNGFSFVGIDAQFAENQCINNGHVISYVREDYLMTPIYGRLLVIETRELARLYEAFCKTAIQKKMSKIDFIASTGSQENFWKVQAFAAAVNAGRKDFPFLGNFPKISDTPDIVHAKKMYIIYVLRRLEDSLYLCSKHSENHYQTLLRADNTRQAIIDMCDMMKATNGKEKLLEQYLADIRAKYH